MGEPDVVYPGQQEEVIAFARSAADHFLTNPTHWTFTGGPIEADAFFAVRWGAAPEKAHAVLVFKISPYFTPVIYGDMDADRVARKS